MILAFYNLYERILTKAWINLLHYNKYERSARDSNLTTVELALETLGFILANVEKHTGVLEYW
jgi:hypothetical protein